MADSKLSALTALTAVAAGDYIEILDVSDTSMGASGTNKKITRANLLNIGSDVQAWDADLDALAALASTAGMVSRTGAGAFAVRTITGTTNRITVANGTGASANPTLDVGSDVYVAGGTDVAVADGGTGGSDAATARTNLGVPQDVNPGWGTWNPTFTGTSTDPPVSGASYSYIQLGKLVIADIAMSTNGTSNAVSKTMTLPVTAKTRGNASWSGACAGAFNNGTWINSTTSVWGIGSGATTVAFHFGQGAINGWTASGGWRILAAVLIYEAA